METIDDIAVEMRRGMIPKHRHDRELLLNYADRIEAAAKALEADRNNWRRQALDEDARANAATCEDSSQVGDADRNCDKYRNVDELYNQFMQYVRRENPTFTKVSPLHTVWDALRWTLAEAKGE